MLHNGLYEQIINKGLDAELAQTDKLSKTEPIDEAEAAKVLAKYVTEIGVTDTVNLDTLRWSAGGYDKTELSNLYTFSGMVAGQRADWVITSLLKYLTDIDEVKGLGFCVSIEHAQFMANYFNAHNIPAMCLTGNSPDEERKAAKDQLVSGRVRFIFVVDIYNEGVDIREVNTVLFLRPTESLTIFLQQLWVRQTMSATQAPAR